MFSQIGREVAGLIIQCAYDTKDLMVKLMRYMACIRLYTYLRWSGVRMRKFESAKIADYTPQSLFLHLLWRHRLELCRGIPRSGALQPHLHTSAAFKSVQTTLQQVSYCSTSATTATFFGPVTARIETRGS